VTEVIFDPHFQHCEIVGSYAVEWEQPENKEDSS